MGLKDIQGSSSARGGFSRLKKSERPKRLRITGKLIILAIVGLVIISIAFIVFLALLPLINPGLSEEEILRIANNEPLIQDFISKNPTYSTNITFLTTQDLVSLSKKYPAIYGDLTKEGIYRVEYSSESNEVGILLLIGKNKKVLKYYRVRSMSLTM